MKYYYFEEERTLLNLKGWRKIVRNNFLDIIFKIEIWHDSAYECETFEFTTIKERDKIYFEIMKVLSERKDFD